MKKVLSLLIVLLMLPMMVNAYEVNPTAVFYRGETTEKFHDFELTDDGGAIVVGRIIGTDSNGVEHNNLTDGLIIKYDKDRNIVWQKRWGGSDSDIILNVTRLTNGNYVAVGQSNSNDIPGFNKQGMNEDQFLLMFDEKGNQISIGRFGAIGTDLGGEIEATSDGGFIFTGYTYSTKLEGIEHKGCGDVVIVKYDKDMNQEWIKSYGGDGYEFDSDIEVLENDDIIVTLYGDSSTIGDYTTKGGDDSYILKYDKDGHLLWTKQIGGNSTDRIHGLLVDSNKNIVVVGYTQSSNFEGINKVNSDMNGFIIVYDQNGIEKWKQLYGGSSSESFTEVTEALDGGYVIAGDVKSTDIPALTNVNMVDTLFVKYDSEGNLKWQQNFGGMGFDYLTDIATLTNGNYWAIGHGTSGENNTTTYKVRDDSYIIEIDVDYEITKKESINGTFEVERNGALANINIKPDEDYKVKEVLVKDSYEKEISTEKINENQYKFVLYDDASVEVGFSRIYKLSINTPENGTATAEQYEEGKARVNAVPNEGYELDAIVIKDTTGKEVVYEEKDGYYFFDVNDDLVITVTFKELPKEVVKGDEEDKEEENPKTADAFIYYACAVVSSLFGIWSVEQYRKTVKE